MKKILFVFILLFTGLNLSYAVVAYPNPIQVKQPDGTVLTIRMHGDEFLNWVTCGNSLVAKGSDGYYHYASFSANGVSQVIGGRVTSTPPGDGSLVKPSASAIEKARKNRIEFEQKSLTISQLHRGSHEASQVQGVSGSPHYLVLLIQFSDTQFYHSKQDFDDLLNKEAYSYNNATGSVSDYYQDNSHGKFNPIFDVYGPITVSNTCSSYANDKGYNQQNGAPSLLVEACNIANDNIDFSKYDVDQDGIIDNVFFFFAGYNAAEGNSWTIWPHRWWVESNVYFDGVRLYDYACTSELYGTSGNTICGIGTFCHEFGHILGLPDFYDTDNETNGQGAGLYTYSIMSDGNYNNNSRTPPYLTYEERRILDWDNGLTLLSEGSNTLLPISSNKAYYCPTGHDGEYYLFESRPQKGWDLYTGAGGMVVYHIDKSDFVLPDGKTASSKWSGGSGINNFATHPCMDLIETVPESQVQYYEQLVFPGSQNITNFNSETSPALVAWNGCSTGYGLSGITFNSNDGTTSFTVKEERQLVGQVLSIKGEPISNAQVTITPVGIQNIAARSTVFGVQSTIRKSVQKAPATTIKASTDANGRFSIKLNEGGSYLVKVKKEGYIPYSSTVTISGVSLNLYISLPTPREESVSILKKYHDITDDLGWGYDMDNIDYYAAIEYSSSELSQYVGNYITDISFLAYNGGTSSVLEMGVKVFFDDEEVCSRAVSTPIFGTICTVDISDLYLKIPEGKSVKFCYYLYGVSPACYPIAIADYPNSTTGGALYKLYYRGSWDNSAWYSQTQFNWVISAGLLNGKTVIDLSGFNTITVQSSYTSDTPFNLTLNQSSINPPSNVIWKIDGTETNPTGVTLPAGTYTIRAYLTFENGRTEVVETKIKVD